MFSLRVCSAVSDIGHCTLEHGALYIAHCALLSIPVYGTILLTRLLLVRCCRCSKVQKDQTRAVKTCLMVGHGKPNGLEKVRSATGHARILMCALYPGCCASAMVISTKS